MQVGKCRKVDALSISSNFQVEFFFVISSLFVHCVDKTVRLSAKPN